MWGWFVDATPHDDEEFLSAGEELLLAEGPGVQGRMDLLTVLMHELGHVLGFDDLESDLQSNSLMFHELAPGLRRLPALSAVDAVFSESGAA